VKLEDRLALGEFIHCEKRAIRRLWMMLPREERGAEASDVRFYALEATRLFDPTRGSSFETFLFAHLHNRTRTQALKARAKKRRPSEGFVKLLDDPAQSSAPTVEILELRSCVSETTREVLDLALGHNTRILRDAFCSRYYRHRVSHILGVPRRQVQTAVQELRREIPKHISNVR
jgi:DNA-directed RNA polymerase specialized sigma24 family protein